MNIWLVIYIAILALGIIYILLPRFVLRKVNKVRHESGKLTLSRLYYGTRAKGRSCPIANSLPGHTNVYLRSIIPDYNPTINNPYSVWGKAQYSSSLDNTTYRNPIYVRIFILLFDLGLYPRYSY